MKKVFNTENYKVMKNYMKFICAILMLLGTSAHAWGTTCTLYGGLGGNTAITTITNGSTIPVCSTNGATWDIATNWASKTYWTTTKYSASSPTTNVPSGSYLYMSGDVLPDGITALYAVYTMTSGSTYYTGAPGYQLSLSPTTGDSWAEATKYIAIQPGTSITITAHPDAGKSVQEWVVLDGNSDQITPTSTTATTFVFDMPSSDVEAEVIFLCPDISGESLTITPSFVWNNSTSSIDATISWTAVEGATSYELNILNPDASYLVNAEETTGTSYEVTNIPNNMSSDDFTISVKAKNSCSYVEEIIEYDFYCKQPNSSTVTASSITTTGARISWDAVEGISEYQMIILNSGKDARIGDVHPTSNTYFDVSDLSAGTTYYARMIVTNDCGRMRQYTSEAFHTQYLVTYDANGGENAPAAVAIASGTTNLPTVGSMSRTGYTFGGWLEGSPSGTLRDVGYTHTVTENITFYAKWTPKTTTIKLHDNNGDANSGTASVDYDATTLTSISHASKAGNTLLGYYDAASDGNIVLTNTGTFVNATGYVVGGKWANESADVTLYAYWSTNSHSVTFDMQGHGSSVASQNKELNQYVDEPSPAPTDPDYNFGGWYKEAGCENTWVFSSDKMPDEDLTLYAKWTAKTYQKRIFACVDISIGLESEDEVPQKVLITSRNGMNIIGVRKLLVTVDGALAGHTVSITSAGGLKFYKLADGKFVELTGAANVLRAPLDAAEVYVSYNPTSDGDGSITAPTFTIACDGESQEFNTGGEYVKVRNLPDAVAIVANVGGSWHGLSANITSSSTPKDQMVAVATEGGILKAYAPTDKFGYKLWQVRTVNSSYDRSGYTYTGGTPAKLYGDRLRFAGYGAKGLLANNNASSNQYNINNTGTINAITSDFTNDENYEWKVTTREVNGQFVYTLQTDQTNNNRYLRLWNGRWGTYQDGKGTEDVYLLPIVETALVDMKPYEWGTDQVVVYYAPEATPVALTGVNMGSDAAASPTFAQIGSSDLWRVSGLTGLTGKPAQQLQVMITENGAAKQGLLQIPLIVSGNSTEAELRGSLTGANMAEKNKVAKNTDVVILSTGKLTTGTASGNFKDLYIYAGGKAIITYAMSFGDMYMRGGFRYIGAETWDVPRAKIDAAVSLSGKLYYDLTMDGTKYYDLAVPYVVDLNEATDDKGDGDFNVWMKVYDGALRASTGKGWKWYDWSGDLLLHPGTGYLIEATPRYGRSYCTVRFPMSPDLSSGEAAKDPFDVTAPGMNPDGTIVTGKTPNNVGWNFVANPYMCNFGSNQMSGNEDDVLQVGELSENEETHKYEWDTEGAKNVRYVTTFNYNTQEYSQQAWSSTVLAPFTGFFVQIAKAGSINFATAGRQLSAPAIIRAGNLPSDMEIAITASGNGQSDETRLHINDELTSLNALEFPDEMTKQLNAGALNFYTISNNTNMYANGMSYADAQEWIPAGVVISAEGTYTFSVGEVNENYIKSVLIKDLNSGYEFDLLKSSPQFVLNAGTIDDRFVVKIVLNNDETTTVIDAVGSEMNNDGPIKFIWHDKMFIMNNGVIYDATGKRVREINK